MLYLNLLSPKKKEEIEQKIIFAILGNLTEMVLLIFVISGIILLGAKAILRNNFDIVVAQSALINREFGAINQDIRKLNYELREIETVQEEFVFWSKLGAELLKTVPAGVKLTGVNLDRETKEVGIVGFAAERSNFLSFKKNLESFPYFANLESPIANLLLPKDINFEFKGALNLTPLREN